jgi:hypothetical protein
MEGQILEKQTNILFPIITLVYVGYVCVCVCVGDWKVRHLLKRLKTDYLKGHNKEGISHVLKPLGVFVASRPSWPFMALVENGGFS